MPLTPGRAAGWQPRGTPALRGWQSRACGSSGETGAGARLRRRRGASCSPGGARLSAAPGSRLPAPGAARSQAAQGIPPPALRRWGARLGSRTCPRQPGSCGRERGDCMGLSRAPAKGEGAARPRRPGRPRAPRAARAPGAFALGSPGAGATRCARRKFAEEPAAAAAGEAPVRSRLPRARRTAAPGRSAQARARRHTRTHWLAPPQPASRCDRSPATRSKKKKKKTCPRYGACAKAFPSPRGVSRGGVRGSARLRAGNWGWESLQP